MSASPLERITPRLESIAGSQRERVAAATSDVPGFRPFLWVLTAFWVYVAISNVLYAQSMQASLSSMKVEHVFAPADARLLQHLMLYPLFLFCMNRSLCLGWAGAWRTWPLQLGLALLFVLPASPLLMFGEYLTSKWTGMGGHMEHGEDWPTMQEFLSSQLPTWIASATTFLVSYCFGLVLMNGFAFYQRLRDTQLRAAALERELTSAHLQTLRMQLSPHTLFNLLHTIRGQIIWDPPAAQTMVVQLGDLLRRLLSAGEREFTRLADELQFVTLYLELQQKRFADRLTVAVPARASLPHAWVPSLILQPLVENAVVHGLASHEGAVHIQVEVAPQGDELVLSVTNTCAPPRAPLRTGIGLANVRERLAVQFGGRAHFTAGEAQEGRWVAQIRMPLLRDGPEGRVEPAV
ncbi:MAG: histidine kinase [Proteobacteria bacterium]|nr:histidine kinase [Pseudomonadota bacterium]